MMARLIASHAVLLISTLQADPLTPPSPSPPPPMAKLPPALETVDIIINISALVIAGYVFFRWLQISRRDLLRSAPLRPNRLAEDAVLIPVLMYILTAAILAKFTTSLMGEPHKVAASLIVANGAQLAGILACSIMASRRFEEGSRAFILGHPAHRRGISPLRLTAVILLAVGLCPAIRDVTAWLIERVYPSYQFPSHPTITALHYGQPTYIVAALWIGAVALAPIAEEMFFRGILQTYFVGLLRSRWLAIILSSTAFALVHITQPHAVPALFVLGVLLGYAYERSGALIAPILIHAAFNLKTLVWDALATT